MTRRQLIRRRVVAGALALFVATWLLILITLASGHDPALAKNQHATSAATATTASKSVTSTPSVSSSNNSSGPSAVTTSQS